MQTWTIELAGPDDWPGFREAARRLLAHAIAPQDIHWLERANDAPITQAQSGDLFASSTHVSAATTLAHLSDKQGTVVLLSRMTHER